MSKTDKLCEKIDKLTTELKECKEELKRSNNKPSTLDVIAGIIGACLPGEDCWGGR